MLAAGARFALRPGGLLLLRPGDAHTKLEQGPCTHIDLAFPAGTARELVCYLYQDDGPLRALAELPLPAAGPADRRRRRRRAGAAGPAEPPAACLGKKERPAARAAAGSVFPRCLLLAGDGGSGLPDGLPAWLGRRAGRAGRSRQPGPARACLPGGAERALAGAHLPLFPPVFSAAHLPPTGTAGGWTMRSTC